MANAVMVKHGTAVLPQFKSLAIRNFQALFDTIDYRNVPLATSKINNWISQQTGGKINDLFKQGKRLFCRFFERKDNRAK